MANDSIELCHVCMFTYVTTLNLEPIVYHKQIRDFIKSRPFDLGNFFFFFWVKFR